MRKFLSAVLVLISVALLVAPALGQKDDKDAGKGVSSGAVLFAQHCAKCHTGGGNIVKANHPIIGSKQLSSIAMFKAYLSSPPGHMPYYQEIVANKKKLESLYQYCKSLKEAPPKEAMLHHFSNGELAELAD